jgi:hypothetical protein
MFGGIWEFGGRITFGANVSNITERLQRLARTNSNMAAQPIDWFALGDEWNRDTQHYSSEPRGDPRLAATEVARALRLD